MKLKEAMILALEKEKAGKKLKIMPVRYIETQLRRKHGEAFYNAFDSAFNIPPIELSGAMK